MSSVYHRCEWCWRHSHLAPPEIEVMPSPCTGNALLALGFRSWGHRRSGHLSSTDRCVLGVQSRPLGQDSPKRREVQTSKATACINHLSSSATARPKYQANCKADNIYSAESSSSRPRGVTRPGWRFQERTSIAKTSKRFCVQET